MPPLNDIHRLIDELRGELTDPDGLECSELNIDIPRTCAQFVLDLLAREMERKAETA